MVFLFFFYSNHPRPSHQAWYFWNPPAPYPSFPYHVRKPTHNHLMAWATYWTTSTSIIWSKYKYYYYYMLRTLDLRYESYVDLLRALHQFYEYYDYEIDWSKHHRLKTLSIICSSRKIIQNYFIMSPFFQKLIPIPTKTINCFTNIHWYFAKLKYQCNKWVTINIWNFARPFIFLRVNKACSLERIIIVLS